MIQRIAALLGATITLWSIVGAAQSRTPSPVAKSDYKHGTNKQGTADVGKHSNERQLARVSEVVLPSEAVELFYEPLRCDSNGNIYFETDAYGASGIHKLAPNGERLAVFQPGANPEFKKIDSTGYFAVADNGELYELVFPHEINRYVFVYKSDGSYKRAIKLEPGFPWMPSSVAVFPAGNLLVSGLEYDREPTGAMWPFTGIFSSDGTLLKEVKLEDDETLRDLAAAGDARVSSSRNPSANHAIDFSKMEAASDGNVYVMRWITPAIFYAISPGGEVVRRFTVDPGDSGYRPVSMHVSDSRIAVLFIEPQTKVNVVKVVDLEGHDLATYTEASAQQKSGLLGTAFACYTLNPERFTFLVSDDDNKLRVQVAEPR